jgi:hypothetical protein
VDIELDHNQILWPQRHVEMLRQSDEVQSSSVVVPAVLAPSTSDVNLPGRLHTLPTEASCGSNSRPHSDGLWQAVRALSADAPVYVDFNALDRSCGSHFRRSVSLADGP